MPVARDLNRKIQVFLHFVISGNAVKYPVPQVTVLIVANERVTQLPVEAPLLNRLRGRQDQTQILVARSEPFLVIAARGLYYGLCPQSPVHAVLFGKKILPDEVHASCP